MKQILILLAFIFVAGLTFAQIMPISPPPTPAPVLAPTQNVTTGPLAPVTITIINHTTFTMNVSVDGAALGSVPPQSQVPVTISAGIHRWEATNKDVTAGPMWGPIDITGPATWNIVP